LRRKPLRKKFETAAFGRPFFIGEMEKYRFDSGATKRTCWLMLSNHLATEARAFGASGILASAGNFTARS
jgi:hypothetical protein